MDNRKEMEDMALEEISKYSTPASWAQEVIDARIERMTAKIKKRHSKLPPPEYQPKVYVLEPGHEYCFIRGAL